MVHYVQRTLPLFLMGRSVNINLEGGRGKAVTEVFMRHFKVSTVAHREKSSRTFKDTLEDVCYKYFGFAARLLLRMYKGLEDSMESAGMRIHPEVYLSVVSFITIIMLLVFLIYVLLVVVKIIPPSPFNLFITPLLGLIPFIALILGLIIPKIMASNRISGLKNEIPYASMYLSVMMSGGLSPFASLLRLRKTSLLPELKKEIMRIQRIALTSGKDQVSAMTEAVRVIGEREFKELLLGYASTLRTGGDVLHYLFSQTESMFRNLAIRIRAMGNNMGIILEAYTIIVILGGLGLYTVFVVSLSFPAFQAFSPDTFFIFAFFLLPGLAILFLYLADTIQVSYPVSHWGTYKALLFSIPLSTFLAVTMVLPYFNLKLIDIPFLIDIPIRIRDMVGLNLGTEAALGLAISLISLSLPVCILDNLHSGRESGILRGVTSFLRDLVENRKTGLSPEKSIQALSSRDYGSFSRLLRTMSVRINLGIPLRKIFESIAGEVKNWPSLINLYLLIDAIEVGGGTEESLETLAEFAETSNELENERLSLLKPLLLVPYMGAALLTLTTVMLLQLLARINALNQTLISINSLIRMLVTPLILLAFTMGLVAGKISSGRTSGGFKHSIALILISMLGVWIAGKLVF